MQPIPTLKPLYPDTAIARGRAPAAVIACPAAPEYRAAAEEFARRIAREFGVRLPVQPDLDARRWLEAKRNVLALGNLTNSPLLRWLYFRGFIRPTSGRRRIRTVSDPWGRGRNVVVLGGVDLESVKANFDPLLKRLRRGDDGGVFLPRTFDPRRPLSSYDRREIARRRKNWDRMPDNYMAYYAEWAGAHYMLQGADEFAALYCDAVLRMARDKYYVHLYLYREVRWWDVVEESPALSGADRLAITNFFRNCVASDREGIGYVRRHLRDVRRGRLIQGNHPTQAACGVLVAAEYLNKYYPSPIHERWFRDALAFFEPYRSKGCYVSDEMGLQFASVDNIFNAVVRTTADPAEHPFLRLTMERLIPCIDNFGQNPAYGDTFRAYRSAAGYFLKAAQIYRRGDFYWMYRFMKTARPDARARIQSSPITGWMPVNVKPERPARFVGLRWAEPDETLYSLAPKSWARRNRVAMQDCFGKVSFRGGAGPRDDYLLLDGVSLKGHAYEDANGVLEYSALGRTFLVSFDGYYGAQPSAHNVALTSLDGLAAEPPMLAARRLWADLPSFAAARTVLHNDKTADWERNVLWLKNRCFVVFDHMKARRPGLLSASVFWRMVGECERTPRGARITQHAGERKVAFHIETLAADSVALSREQDPQATYGFYRYGKPAPPLDDVPHEIHVLRARKARNLRAGEGFTLAACFWVSGTGRKVAARCAAVGENALRMELNGRPLLAARGPLHVGSLRIDAELALVDADALRLVAARRVEAGGRTLFASAPPISFEWRLDTGALQVEAPQAGHAEFAGREIALPFGASEHRVLAGALRGPWRDAVQAVEPAPPQPATHTPQAPRRLETGAQRRGRSPAVCGWTGRLRPHGRAVVIVGRENGAVEALDADTLQPIWTYRCKGRVNSIAAGDIDGDHALEVLAGSDDHHLHVLRADGKAMWKWKPPFDELKARIAYNEWLWPEPFVKKVAARDLDRDGKAEILAGGGMNTFALNGRGELLWAMDTGTSHHPTMQAVAFGDVNGDGREEPIVGASDMWYVSCMYAVGAGGKVLKQFHSDGWCSGAKTAVWGDRQGKRWMAYGTRRGGVVFVPDVRDAAKYWYRRFADMVTQLAVLKRSGPGEGPLLAAAGGDTGWVTALDFRGDRAWAVYFDSAVARLAAGADTRALYVACQNGGVFELDETGRVRRSFALPAAPTALFAHPSTGVVACTRNGRVLWLH